MVDRFGIEYHTHFTLTTFGVHEIIDFYYSFKVNFDASFFHALTMGAHSESFASINTSSWNPPATILGFVYGQELAGLGISANN